MNKLEELHLDGITQAEYSPEDKVPNYVGFAKESAKITEQIAIEFSEWVSKYDWVFMFDKNYWINDDVSKHPKTTKELFQEFLKTKQ